MHWAKRQFAYAAFAPYQDRLEKLLRANPARYREFIMVSTDTEKPGVSTYYVGVPEKPFLAIFDGFTPVEEVGLPKEIDTLLIADATTDEFKSRFKFKNKF
jgi:hypothetical protein